MAGAPLRSALNSSRMRRCFASATFNKFRDTSRHANPKQLVTSMATRCRQCLTKTQLASLQTVDIQGRRRRRPKLMTVFPTITKLPSFTASPRHAWKLALFQAPTPHQLIPRVLKRTIEKLTKALSKDLVHHALPPVTHPHIASMVWLDYGFQENLLLS